LQNKNSTKPKKIFDSKQIYRCIKRISYEILEKNHGGTNNEILLLGIHTRGFPLANRISKLISETENIKVPCISLGINQYRDDLTQPKPRNKAPFNNIAELKIENKVVILVDDVLYTGRSIRAAMDAITDSGRPRKIQLAVLVDRGHREYPIRPDYVGKNLPTSHNEKVQVLLKETDGIDEILISDQEDQENSIEKY
tara:strand:+ start:61377 stop:61967 length:591 start_codon:yes stop_codon:yes gene_type:complete